MSELGKKEMLKKIPRENQTQTYIIFIKNVTGNVMVATVKRRKRNLTSIKAKELDRTLKVL